MHATIDVRFELSIDDDKTLPLATLAEAVTDQNLEAVLLESLVESLDAASVEALCGEKHAHGNGDQRFQRAGTDTRTAVTTAGEHEFSLHYVEDTAASPDESSYFRPVEDVLDFDGRTAISRTSPPKRRSRYLAQLSRRCQSRRQLRLDAVADHHQPPCQKYGHKLKQFLPDCVAGTDADAVIPDGTKCHSQDDDRSSHSVQATLGEDTAEESRSLLDLSVNADWDETAAELDDIGAVTDDATVVSDADSGIVTAFTDENRDHQLDRPRRPNAGLHPLGRWRLLLGPSEGDRFGGDRRGVPSEELCGEASSSGEFAAIRSRIARTRERLEKTAWQLEQFGSAKAAGYLRRWLPSIVTFAEHAVEGFEVPWTSNPVERLMGEVSKRCKNQWMRWTAEGLEAILQLRLVKYADPEYYQAFLDELLQRSTKTAINCDLSIESTSGKV